MYICVLVCMYGMYNMYVICCMLYIKWYVYIVCIDVLSELYCMYSFCMHVRQVRTSTCIHTMYVTCFAVRIHALSPFQCRYTCMRFSIFIIYRLSCVANGLFSVLHICVAYLYCTTVIFKLFYDEDNGKGA